MLDSLLICPNADQRCGQSGRHESCHEQQGDETFGEGVLLLVQGVDVWALQPVRTYMIPRRQAE